MAKQKVPSPALCCPSEPSDFLAAVALPTDEAVADEQLSVLAKALAHPVRVRILRMLAKRDARMCADIVDELDSRLRTVRTQGM